MEDEQTYEESNNEDSEKDVEEGIRVRISMEEGCEDYDLVLGDEAEFQGLIAKLNGTEQFICVKENDFVYYVNKNKIANIYIDEGD